MSDGADFLILGAMRSGTSSLHSRLIQHPGILMPVRKETHYFDLYYGKDYAKLLPRRPVSGILLGETTPEYLYLPYCAERIRETLPGAKLIAILRNPVDRAYSHWALNVRKELETRSFEDAIAENAARDGSLEEFVGEGGAVRWGERMKGLSDPGSRRHYYLEIGRYERQLDRYRRLFPENALRIVLFDDFIRDPKGVLDQLFDFLGLERGIDIDHAASKNTEHRSSALVNRMKRVMGGVRYYDMVAKVPRFVKKPLGRLLMRRDRIETEPPTPEALAMLREYYEEGLSDLSSRLGRDVTPWLRGGSPAPQEDAPA